MDVLLKTAYFPEIEGINTRAGILMNGGSVSEYLKALNAFCFDVEEKADELSSCIRKKDLNLYITIVHAFENAALNIGAVKAADLAMNLKSAYEDGAIDFIMLNNKSFISHLYKLKRNIGFALRNGLSEISKTHAGEAGHLNDSLIRINKALKNMAIGEAKTTLTELKTKTWESRIQDTIIKISRHILLFEYEEATKTIDLIMREKEQMTWNELPIPC